MKSFSQKFVFAWTFFLAGSTLFAAPAAFNWTVSAPLFLALILIFLIALIAGVFFCCSLLQFKKVFSVLPVQLGVCDESGKIFFYRSGEPDDESRKPRTISELPVEVHRILQDVLPDLFRSGKNKSMEFNIFRSRRKFDFYPAPHLLPGRRLMMWTSSDITQLSQAYQERARTAERFQRTLSSIGDAVVVTNCDTEITLLNPVAAKLCNCSEEQVLGKKFDECFKLRLPDGTKDSPVEQVVRTGVGCRFSTALSVQGRHDLMVDGQISPVIEDRSIIVGTVLCFRDVTELVRKKQQLQTALEFAQTADRAKSDFLSTMNHEFRSSLNNILGYSDLLRMHAAGAPPPEAAKIQKESENLLNLLNDVMDLSKNNFKPVNIAIAPFQFKDLCRELQRIFQKTSEVKKIPLVVSANPAFPRFLSDYKALRQILVRLLSYAFTLASRGEIVVSALWLPPVFRIDVSVEIESCGHASHIPETEIPFTRRLCENLNAKFELKQTDRNNILSVVFPKIDFLENVQSPVLPEIVSVHDKPRKSLCLLVDDIPVNLLVLGGMLKRLKMPFVTCSSVPKALAELENYLPAAIFTDLWMPGFDGDEFARCLAANPQTAAIPRILVTADNLVDSKIAGMFQYVIYKPLDFKKLEEIVQAVAPDADKVETEV